MGQTWMEDFKAQQAALGVTQGQLADMAGFSRGYLNRLLNRSQELPERYKARLAAALEKLQPDAIKVKIDYVRIRFPTLDVQNVVENVLWLRMRHLGQQPRGFYGYTTTFYIGDIAVMVSPYEGRGTLVELKGKGCAQFSAYLNGQGRSWNAFFQHCLDAKGVFKRLDIAIDDRADFLDIPRLAEKCDRGECVTRFRSYEVYQSGRDAYLEEQRLEQERWEACLELMQGTGFGDDPLFSEPVELLSQEGIEPSARKCRSGHTLYIGSMRSEAYFCIYEKDYEQFVRHGIPPNEAEAKNRFEIRLKNERAYLAAKDFIAGGNLIQTAFSIINHYVRFVDKDGTKPRTRWPTDRDWTHFIGTHRGRLKLTKGMQPFDWLRILDWLAKQAAPTVKMLMELDRIQGTHVVEEMIGNAVLTKRHEQIMQEILAQMETQQRSSPKS
nr:replication initiation factor domain-containing protein [uncultured Agathobaculum sp.]